ncbi:hypothetical protein TNCV_472811 [Trichonephila clavipes]|nr:hypothetical protein TNCV_472811 [Trichonephila clavipes]
MSRSGGQSEARFPVWLKSIILIVTTIKQTLSIELKHSQETISSYYTRSRAVRRSHRRNSIAFTPKQFSTSRFQNKGLSSSARFARGPKTFSLKTQKPLTAAGAGTSPQLLKNLPPKSSQTLQ